MIDYYGLGTPNGQKISIALEEMKLSYNPIRVDILKGEQFTEDFKKVNPNSKIPAIVDHNGPDGKPFAIFESGAILLYLAERYDQNGEFLPKDPVKRYQTIQWLMFQMAGVGPMFGQMGHFVKYAPEKIPYAVNRYEKEAIRLFGVLNHQLATNKYIAGDTYTIADMAIYPWVVGVDKFYNKLNDMGDIPHVRRWLKDIEQREAVQKGMKVLGVH